MVSIGKIEDTERLVTARIIFVDIIIVVVVTIIKVLSDWDIGRITG